MKSVRDLLKGIGGGRRPPTGPLTTAEAQVAEELRQDTLEKDEERVAHERPGPE